MMSPLIVMQSEIMIELSNPQKIKSYTITLFSFKKKKVLREQNWMTYLNQSSSK